MTYDNNNSGSLFRNEKKERDTHPDARGEAEVVCPHCSSTISFWLSAWVNIIKKGKRAGQKMQSLKFSVKDDKPAAQPSTDFTGEDIPF